MYIYKITNKINGKIYIGQTIQSIKNRWWQHKSDAKKDRHDMLICKALRKYGFENFTIECLFEAQSIEELNEAENKYIYELNSLAPNGYNLLSGGNNRILHQDTKNKISLANKKRKVVAKNISTQEVLFFDSGSDAAKILNIDVGAIWNACVGKFPSYKNYLWRFEGDPEKIYNPKTFPKAKAVIGISLLTGEIKEYHSAHSAIKDGFCPSGIKNCLYGRTKKHKNYIWKYKEEQK